MGPRRKKSKPNDKAPVASPTVNNSNSTSQPSDESRNPVIASDSLKISDASINSPSSSKLTRQESGSSTNNDRDGTASRKSWYGGSWKTKAPALAEIAKDGIAAASRSSLNLSKTPSKDNDGSESPAARYMEKRLGTPRKSMPSIAAENAVDAEKSPEKSKADGEVQRNGTKDAEPEAPLPPDPFPKNAVMGNGKNNVSATSLKEPTEKARPTSGWFGWWSRPDGYGSDADKGTDTSKANGAIVAEAQTTPLPDSPAQERNTSSGAEDLKRDQTANGAISPHPSGDQAESQTRKSDPGASSDGNEPGSSRSWFGLWSKTENQKASPPPKDGNTLEVPPRPSPTEPPDKVEKGEEKSPDDVDSSQIRTKPTPKPSAWAFWSKDKPKEDGKTTPGGTQKQIGEIAVADTPSQSHPEAAQYNEQETQSVKEPSSKSKDRKRKKLASSLESSKSTPAASPSLQPSQSSKSADQLSELGSKEPSISTPTTSKAASIKLDKSIQKRQRDEKVASIPNLLLPSLRSTYPIYQAPSYWDQIRRLILTGSPRDPKAPRHVDLLPTKEFPRIKRALAIGVHGFFPAQFVQMILGQPTGTSIRFANAAASAIKRWAEEHQPSDASPLSSNAVGGGITRRDSAKTMRSQSSDIEIEKVALEGEGMVADRVDTLWKLLLNWLPSIRRADFIVIAAHSQGVPVAIQLVAKLLQFGCVREEVRVGICAMAGVNMGPFAELKSRFLAGSAVELFDFALRDSRVRQNYEAALDHCLSKGVRISFIGSLDDQLVSLESSTFTPITHPLIHRAVFINSALHASDFIPHLVGFALKLRNLGISDHGLIRELSGPLAGSLYTGDGHSKLYDDGEVFLRAVEFALETTGTESIARNGPVKLELDTAGRPGSSGASEVVKESAGANPYYLPWALRGVLEEPYIKEHLQEEVKGLVEMFEKWRPVSKVLKDVKFRLEAVRSKL